MVVGFKKVVEDWFVIRVGGWLEFYVKQVRLVLEKDVYLVFGKWLIVDIIVCDVLVLFQKKECIVLEQVCKLCWCIGEIFKFVVIIELVMRNLVVDFDMVLKVC